MKSEANWICIDGFPCHNNLPVLDQKVFVTNESKDVLTAAVRRFESDGWHWEQYSGGDLLDDESYEYEDDYNYFYWIPFPRMPRIRKRKLAMELIEGDLIMELVDRDLGDDE